MCFTFADLFVLLRFMLYYRAIQGAEVFERATDRQMLCPESR